MSTRPTLPVLPYGRQQLGEEEIEAVSAVLRSDWLTQGPTVERFEGALAELCGATHAVAASSGTAALHLAYAAAGVGPETETITVSNTFLATANAVLYAGGRPRFVDVVERTLCMDPLELQAALDAASRPIAAIVPVHFAGHPADMEAVARLAADRRSVVIEDAAHALGSRWRDREGRWHTVGSCSHSAMTVFSFHPVKQITTAEGGAVLTNDAGLAQTLRELRAHGSVRDPGRLRRAGGPWHYEMQALGFNYRLSDVHAAIGLVQLQRLPGWVERRRSLVERYRERLRSVAGVRPAIDERPDARAAWHLMLVRVPSRAAVYRALHDEGIRAQVHYLPVHLHPYYRERLGTAEGDLPVTEAYYEEALSLPLYPGLADDDVDRVVQALARALDRLSR